jgi:sulfite oxidase
VLRAVGIAPSARQVAFTGLDEVQPASGAEPFGAAIPVEKALTPEVLVAYEITGRQLPPEHEVALRIVAPGYIGARSVKRLSEIMVRSTPSSSFFQRDDYTRCGESLNELPPNCAICSRREGATVRGLVPVEGYVLAGGGRAVERVEVSPDGGVTWTEAALAGSPSSPWAWLIWRAIVELGAGSNEVVVRAWDSAAVGQPDDPASIWNPRGHLNKAGTG